METNLQKYWDDVFKTAHISSGPNSYGITIQKSKPKEGRSIFKEDEKEILQASKKYGYSIILDSLKVVVFYKKKE